MDRYRTICFAEWTGTGMFAFVSWQGTAGSQRLELTVANVGTTGYHCKELPVPRGWNSWFPTWEPWVTIAKNFRFLKVGTDGSQRGNQRLPWQGTAGSQTLKLTVPNLGTRGYHCKELPVPRGSNLFFSKLSNYHCKELPVATAWNSLFQTWKSIRYQWKDLLIPKS